MNIVYIYKSLAQKAGTERILIDKMNYLCKEHQVYIITYEQGKHPIPFPMDNRITHIDLNVRFFTRYKFNGFKRLYTYFLMKRTFKKKLFEICRSINPDIIICTTYAAPLISVFHHAATRFRAKWVIEAHTITDEIKKINDFSNPILRIYAKFWDWHIQRTISKCDALVTLTPNDAQSWKQIKTPHIIPNSITYPIQISKNQSKTVITAGRLEYQKGYDLLIETWKLVNQKHPEWKLKIYGEGSMKETLKEKIHSYQLCHSVLLIPPINNIYDEYMNSAIYVSSSRFEGFGLSIAEAMSCGIPCVAFDCPHGPRNIIKHNEDGILVENMDTTALADKLNYLIEYESVRQELGKNARVNIKRYAPENIMGLWNKLFTELHS